MSTQISEIQRLKAADSQGRMSQEFFEGSSLSESICGHLTDARPRKLS
jgi:hypothetical protein